MNSLGYGYGIVNGKKVGYNIKATCEYSGCTKEIDRGLAYACGGVHGEGEDFCDKYCCYEHLVMGGDKQRCPDCYELWAKTPAGQEWEAKMQSEIENFRKNREQQT